MDGDGAGLGVDVLNEVVAGGYEDGVAPVGQHFKEDVEGGVVDVLDDAHPLSAVCLEQLETLDLRIADVIGVVVRQAMGEEHLAVGQFACPFLGVDVAEFHQCAIVSVKAILLHEERDEDAVDFEDEVFRLHAVKHIVVEEEIHLALDTVGASYAANFKDF